MIIVDRADGISRTTAQKVLDAFVDSIQDNVAAGIDVSLTGFGRFTRAERAARTGRNPRTGVELKIPASVIPQFKAGKAFKDRVKE